MAESIFDLIYGTDRFKKPQTGLMSSFDDTDYGDLTAQPEKDYLQGMKTRDKIALLTSMYPVIGGITGTYADMMNMIENPEERTKLNAGLMALNWIPSGRAMRNIAEKTKDMIPDPRFRKRKSKSDIDQKQINELTTETEANTNIDIPEVSIQDLEGKGIVSSMADRTMGGKIVTHVNGIELKHPVITRGGDQYMTMGENVKAGNIWASDTSPVSGIINRADELKKITGETPILAPFKMAPSSGDFSHQTLEMMLAYNDTVLPRSVKSEMNKALKEIDPTFVGLNSPKFQAWLNSGGKGSGNIRKQMLHMLDRDFRTKGGLSLPEARVSVTDVNQLSGVDDASLRYLGTVEGGRSPYSNHPTYSEAIKGEPVGVLKEKNLSLLDLLDESDLNRGLTNPKAWSGVDRTNIDPTDMYLLRTSPKSGVITDKKLRELESKGLLDTATKTTKPKESGVLANITTKNADKSDDAYQMTYWQNDGKYGDALDSRNLPNDDEIYLGAYGRQTKDFILVDGGKVQSQKSKMRKDDYQDEERFYTIYDKNTKKPVGTTKLVEQDVEGRRTITGLVDIKINDQNQGIGKKFINNLKQSAKADPYSVAPEFKVFDVKDDALGFWEKVGAKDFYARGELGGTHGIKSANSGKYTQDIPKGFKPEKVSKDYKGQKNTILNFGDDAVDTSKGLLGNVGSKSVKNLDNFKELKSGDTVTTYHASPSKEIEGGKFDLSKENLHGGTGLPKGVHSAPQINNTFTDLKEFGDNVFELETKIGNLFDYGNPDPKLIKKMQDSVDELFPKASASHKQFLKDKLKNGSFTPSEFNEDFFKHHGIDTIKDGFERIISLNPDNVKVVKKVR